MLKIKKFHDLDGGRVGINFDGTIIIQDDKGEYHIHPDDLKVGPFPSPTGSYTYNVTDERLTVIQAAVDEWLGEGNQVMDKDTIRPLSLKQAVDT